MKTELLTLCFLLQESHEKSGGNHKAVMSWKVPLCSTNTCRDEEMKQSQSATDSDRDGSEAAAMHICTVRTG